MNTATEARTGKIHAAKLADSPRLQQVASILSGETWMTALEIDTCCREFYGTPHMAIHSDISELRANGLTVESRMRKGTRHTEYRLIAPVNLDYARRRLATAHAEAGT